jgi:hypothetical protein
MFQEKITYRHNIILRATIFLALLFLISFLPFWIWVALFVFSFFVFGNFYEGIFLAVFFGAFYDFSITYILLVAFGLFVVAFFAKKRLVFYK